MPTDIYIKIVLTLIAACLLALALDSYVLHRAAHYQVRSIDSPIQCGDRRENPCYVRIIER